MIFKDYYKILGLENNNVTPEQIKQAYREQAKKYHPDINNTSNYAEERFKDINEAYKTLSNSSTKRKYDRMWNSRIGKKQKNNTNREKKSAFAEFLQMFFGEIKNNEKGKNEIINDKKTAVKGENIETEITVSIFDAFYGVEKKLALRTVTGKIKEFKIKIPAGIRNQEKIRLIGQGKPGKNGGKPGDLLVKVKIIDNKKLKLNGVDLNTNLYITPWEAALGAKVNIASVDEEILVYIPQGTQSGATLRLQGKGYLDGKGSRGDLIINVQIMNPTNITEEETKIFQKLKQISKYNPREVHS